MKRWIGICGMIGLILGLTGCSSYYYAKLSSADREDTRNSTRDFVFENDTVSVIYCFYGENAPVQITVHNKLNEPLYVDWTRSGMIIDDVAASYDKGSLSIQGGVSMSSSGSTVQWGDGYSSSSGSASGRFSGEVVLPKGITFVPPQSRVEHTPIDLAQFSFEAIPKSEYTSAVWNIKSQQTTVRTISFTEADSPLRFRSFLTLYTDSHDSIPRRPIYLERNFYLSRLIKTGNVPPDSFNEGIRKEGDFFYVHKVKGANTGLILGVIAVGVAGIAVEAAVGSSYTY